MIPKTHTAGLALDARIAVGNVATASLQLRGPSALDISGQVSAAQARFFASASETASLAAGLYSWRIIGAPAGGYDVEIARGQLTIEPNFAALPEGHDPRSQAQIALDAIKAVLANRASLDQSRYRIKDRELQRMTVSELLALKRHFETEVAREQGRGLHSYAVRVSLS